MHREGYYSDGEARLKGDSVSGETTEGLFIQRSLWSRNNVGKRIDESRTTAVCLCRPRVTLNPSLIDDYRRRRASIDNRSRPTLALARHSTRTWDPFIGPTTFFFRVEIESLLLGRRSRNLSSRIIRICLWQFSICDINEAVVKFL